MEDLLQTVESIKDTYSSIEMGFLYLPKQQAGILQNKKKEELWWDNSMFWIVGSYL